MCKGDVRYWNMQAGIFEAIEIVGKTEEGKLTTVSTLFALEQYLQRHRYKYNIIRYLIKNGLLTEFEEDGDTVTVSYKNEQVKKA